VYHLIQQYAIHSGHYSSVAQFMLQRVLAYCRHKYNAICASVAHEKHKSKFKSMVDYLKYFV